MNTVLKPISQTTTHQASKPMLQASKPMLQASKPMLPGWLCLQAMNVIRHQEALHPFQNDEFGTGAASPTEAHIAAVNQVVALLQGHLTRGSHVLQQSVVRANQSPTSDNIARALAQKEQVQQAVMLTEKVWDFYFELFGQRQTRFANWLLSCDRIARDCYQAVFVRLGVPRSIPSPPPFTYMRTGFSPLTYTRGIPFSKIGKQINPFPLIQLPYHRMVNPWTLGALLHEVSHNLQNDLGLKTAIPLALHQRLTAAGVPPIVRKAWVRWNRETFADLSGLLLGGPAIVGSLMDVVGRSVESTTTFQAQGVHPTPYLRVFLSIELLRRLGFVEDAKRYEKVWRTLYPKPEAGIPAPLRDRFQEVIKLVVDTICFQPFAALGNRRYVDVVPFTKQHQALIEEAAIRLAKGIDPGILPARFLIGAVRLARERNLAPAETLQKNFYSELTRR